MSPTLLVASDILARGRLIVIAGDGGEDLARVARAAADPAISVMVTRDGADWPATSPAHGRTPVAGAAAAYVCENGVCGLPIVSAEALAQEITSA